MSDTTNLPTTGFITPTIGGPLAPQTPAAPPPLTPEQEAALRLALFRQSFATIGECMIDMATVLAQGLRPENAAARGNIAAGLERAAAQVRGQKFTREPDPQHVDNKGTKG